MRKTIWVQATRTDRRVILSEYDEQHPGNHEVFIAGYEEPRFDADGNPVVPANPPIEVGDTALVRQRIAEGDLVQVDAPPKTTKEPAPSKATKESEK